MGVSGFIRRAEHCEFLDKSKAPCFLTRHILSSARNNCNLKHSLVVKDATKEATSSKNVRKNDLLRDLTRKIQ